MKKILTVLVFILIFGINSNSYAIDNYQMYCPSKPYNIGNSFSRGLQKVTGINFLSTQMAEMVAANEIKKQMDGKFDIKIKSFSATDLSAGKFKSVKVVGKNINSEGNYISYFNAQSLCGYTQFDYKSKPAVLKTPMALKFSAQITEKDLQNTIASPEYQKQFAKMRVGTNKFSLFEVQNPSISIENNHLYFGFETKTNMLLFKEISKYKVGFNVKVADKKMKFSDVTLLSPLAMLDISDISFILNRINPIIYDKKIMEGFITKIELNNAAIKDNKINVDGVIVLQK